MAEALELVALPKGLFAARFSAMASPCEILLETDDRALAQRLGELAQQEAVRIEAKFSRYRADSVVSAINQSGGAPVTVDAETALLLDFAATCHQLSDGLFDITSGVLRRAWKFDGSDRLPSTDAVQALLPLVGFERLQWQAPTLRMPAGMELDFGGIGKEYAVDRVLNLLRAAALLPGAADATGETGEAGPAILVNFGGDLCCNHAPQQAPWQVGIERPDQFDSAEKIIALKHGALATSGDARRFLIKDGVRYGHILNPQSGWPVTDAPRSVTVAAATCMEAGMLATFSLLQGTGAAEFLDAQGARYWLGGAGAHFKTST